MSANKKGKVYLVGAGPGDPGLITVKGLELIKSADVIVYDSLIPQSLLKSAPGKCELIYVGKSAGKHTIPQEEINDLLCKLGKENKMVVRLKGGDPFVFGRGGEEALALKRAGVQIEVVPGVTSGIAAPAYAGIPVSHRTVASDVHFITGHEDPLKAESQLDYSLTAKLSGTLVFFMGVEKLPVIVEQLIANGKNPQTPCAVIHKGCTPFQKTVKGCLDDIVQKSAQENIKPPAIIVIGDVVNLRDEIAWFEKAPLFGKSVVVTRSRETASKLSNQLSCLGANVIELPAISIQPAVLTDEEERIIIDTSSYDWIFFTSQNAIEPYFEIFYRFGFDSRKLANVKIAAIGSATADALREKGIIPDLVPDVFTSQGLLDKFRNCPDAKFAKRVLLPRADIASDDLTVGLREMNIDVIEIDIYRTLPAEIDKKDIELIMREPVDYVTFTSSSTVDNFCKAVGKDDFVELSNRAKYVSIGPVTSEKIRELGGRVFCQASVSNIAGIIDAIIEAEKEKA